MKNRRNISYHTILITILVQVIFLYYNDSVILAQEPPPVPPTISSTSQQLSFGSFTYASTSGTVTVPPVGIRSGTGDLMLVSSAYSSALFDITATPGTVLQIVTSNTTLNSGGSSMDLQIGGTSPAFPVIVPDDGKISLYVGGTLSVKTSDDNPPGNYQGQFEITLMQE